MANPEIREIAARGYQNDNRCTAVWKADNNTLSDEEGQGLFDGFLIILLLQNVLQNDHKL
ncbi:hypothetical protein [uncultured Amphritea sp.]|uniref:hypothetical protein n=1 Tax=Amphritea sp. TaxID=1872502 RepID=UPI001E08535C|nr:hypothetical protein [uncultured Amphritea sp.]MBR9866629.1 hypothetical protein [Oceanospirillales bacterium]MBR9888056.1 hypothetical protein [Oceanospirillales bacterium]